MAIPRPLLLCAGVLLIIAAPVVGVLPGPGGIFVFAAGLILVLRSSARARRRWVRVKRRWPRLGHLADRAMRRQSALRRHIRYRAAGQTGAADGSPPVAEPAGLPEPDDR